MTNTNSRCQKCLPKVTSIGNYKYLQLPHFTFFVTVNECSLVG
jgi:hypothetical protein